VVGETGPEVRIQTLYRDHFTAVARRGHPLLDGTPITPERYAAEGHVVMSLKGAKGGLVDAALATLGLERRIAAIVPSFPAALAIVTASDLLTHVPSTYLNAVNSGRGLVGFPLPVETAPITVSQMWHPRMDADPGHRWLRSQVLAVCRGG
jgi:DNA-binding transcriptional LysR family regulator